MMTQSFLPHLGEPSNLEIVRKKKREGRPKDLLQTGTARRSHRWRETTTVFAHHNFNQKSTTFMMRFHPIVKTVAFAQGVLCSTSSVEELSEFRARQHRALGNKRSI
jgi:hypothetical protein